MLPRVLLALLLLTSCDGRSPTEPAPAGFSGSFRGRITDRLPDEDWSSVSLRLEQHGDVLTGELTSRNGVRHPVTGTIPGAGGLLEIGELPRPNECLHLTLRIDDVEQFGPSVRRFSGTMQGRCFGTVLGATYSFGRA